MSRMRVRYHENLRTEATHLDSQAKLQTSAPKDNQGEGDGFSPTDLLATSLASCMLTIIGIRAKGMGLRPVDLNCEVEKKMQAQPRKVAEIVIRLSWGQTSCTLEQRHELETAALSCPVILSLDPQMKKTIEWVAPVC